MLACVSYADLIFAETISMRHFLKSMNTCKYLRNSLCLLYISYRPNLNFKPTLNFLPTSSFRTKPIIEPHNRNFLNSCNALDRHKFLTHVVYTPTDQLAHLAHVTYVPTKFKRPFFCISVQSNQKVVFVLFGIIRRVLYITISWFNIRTNKGFISLVYMQV